MSRRHQQSRRRSYGRRQHELHERRERNQPIVADTLESPVMLDLDAAAQRLSRLAFGNRTVQWAEGAA
jgi:hypothetical protein